MSVLNQRVAPAAAPRVSVIIPVYNGGVWLGPAMDSILRQTLADLELLVVDDGSTDGSGDEIARRAATDPRVRAFRQPNLGPAAALNLALAQVRAPLVARLDADDLAHMTRLERQVAHLDAHPEVGAVGAWAIDLDEAGRPLGRRQPETNPAVIRRDLMRRNPLIHSAVTMRADILRRVGGYRSAFDIAEDYDLWLRISEVAELANLPEFLGSYRVHPSGSGNRNPLRQAFSARLARRSASIRRATGTDPAGSVARTPDWRTDRNPDAFYAEDAALFRWLDGCRVEGDPMMVTALEGAVEGAARFTHQERRLVAKQLLRRLRDGDPVEASLARKILIDVCRRRPATTLRAAWSLRR